LRDWIFSAPEMKSRAKVFCIHAKVFGIRANVFGIHARVFSIKYIYI